MIKYLLLLYVIKCKKIDYNLKIIFGYLNIINIFIKKMILTIYFLIGF